jgi:FkbM family methyltransferase
MALTAEQKKLKKRFVLELNAVEDVDRSMIHESILNYDLPEVDYRDKVCLDLGTNIGSFTKIAIERGAKKVQGIECDPRNYQIAAENFKSYPQVEIVHAAVSGSNDEFLKIYKSNAKSNHSSTSIIKRSGTFKEYDEVRNFHIDQLLTELKPDIVKIDIEGAEYEIIESVIAYKPQVLFVELHGNHEKANSALRRLTALYEHSRVEEIIIFQKVGGYDCMFQA